MTPIKVLFLCASTTPHEARWLKAYLKKFGGQKFFTESAGIETGTLNPLAVEVMREDGIDISGNQTKNVFDFFKEGRVYNYVITVCDEANAARCPLFPGLHKKINWSFDDPSAFTGSREEKLTATRNVPRSN
jgi:arsenate reductase